MSDSTTDSGVNLTVSAGAVQPHACRLEPGQHRICTCGKSGRWPLCDAEPACPDAAVLQLRRQRWVWFCRCGRSRRAPYCDGSSHAR